MRYLAAICACAIALVAVSAAQAGGWATVSVDPLPTGVDAGDPWSTEITILQHGRTPLTGLEPLVVVREQASGLEREFRATPSDEPGVYDARVLFPEAGDWNVRVETGWWGEGGLTFGPVAIGDGAGVGAAPGSFPVAPVAVLGLVVGLLAAAALAVRRRWGPSPAR
jgi:hypothetical protein